MLNYSLKEGKLFTKTGLVQGLVYSLIHEHAGIQSHTNTQPDPLTKLRRNTQKETGGVVKEGQAEVRKNRFLVFLFY